MEKYVGQFHGLLPVHDDAEQLSRAFYFHPGCDRDLSHYRFHRHFPGHVYGGNGTHARNRNPEVDRGLEALYRECDPARDACCWRSAGLWSEYCSVWRRAPESSTACPRLPVVVTGGWILRSTIIAIVGAILGALIRRTRRRRRIRLMRWRTSSGKRASDLGVGPRTWIRLRTSDLRLRPRTTLSRRSFATSPACRKTCELRLFKTWERTGTRQPEVRRPTSTSAAFPLTISSFLRYL